jgi:molybdate transport system substrate-binding protein
LENGSLEMTLRGSQTSVRKRYQNSHPFQTTIEEIKKTMNTPTHDIRVMTSGAFTAAYLELIPQLELLTKKKIVTAATSIGTGENSIPNRLKRGEAVDVVIVADAVLREFIKDGLVLAETYTPVARSAIGMAVRAGAPKPDISSVDALKRTLLQAKSIAYSASVSGQYLTTELYQRLGIADQVLSKSRLIGGGERVGAAVARGEAELGFQQISELLPVPGIEHITPLPPEVQKVSVFSAGVATSTRDSDLAHSVIKFLASPEAAHTITKSGLEPIGNR